jgi:hypothetical protein
LLRNWRFQEVDLVVPNVVHEEQLLREQPRIKLVSEFLFGQRYDFFQ